MAFLKVSDMQRELQVVLDSIKENASEAWTKMMNPCRRSQGDYFEGGDSQNCVKLAFIF
jgi:hypothetical protein